MTLLETNVTLNIQENKKNISKIKLKSIIKESTGNNYRTSELIKNIKKISSKDLVISVYNTKTKSVHPIIGVDDHSENEITINI